MAKFAVRSLVVWIITTLVSFGANAQREVSGDRWPAFRGGSDGRTGATLPTTWSKDDGVAWTKSIPGDGQSSPVVFDGRVFVTSIGGPGQDRVHVTCFRATDGGLLWSRSYAACEPVKVTKTVSRAAPTPAVDADGVYAFFKSGDLIALTLDGETRWRRSLTREYGSFKGNHGVASSVVCAADGLVLLVDHGAPGFLIKLDKATGKNLWKAERPKRVSWTTPIVATSGDRAEIVISSNGVVEAFDLANGKKRWALSDVAGNTVPSPVMAGDLVVIAASTGKDCLAVRRPTAPAADATIAWRVADAKPTGFASPVVVGDSVLFLNKAGVVECVALSDGTRRWRTRIEEGCWASPITDGERVWFFGKTGKTTVLRVTPARAEVIAKNERAAEGTVYGVAAIDGAFFVREGGRLTRIGTPPTAAASAEGANATKRVKAGDEPDGAPTGHEKPAAPGKPRR